MIANSLKLFKLDKTVNKIEQYLKSIDINNISDEDLKSMFYSDNLTKSISSLYVVIFRTKGIKLFKSQLRAILALCNGYIVEMKTGEGKTLVIMCYALLKGKTEKIHIATTNDYLSERDYNNSKEICEFYGVKSIFNDRENRKNISNIYSNNIVYSSCESLIFDYLEYEYATDFTFTFNNIVIDEIDYVLVDNATSSFSVNSQVIGIANYDEILKIKMFAESLNGYKLNKDELMSFEKTLWDKRYDNFDYYYEESSSFLYLSDNTYDLIHNLYLQGEKNLNDVSELYLNVVNYLRALLFFKLNVNYTIKDNSIILINNNNGRMMPNSSYEIDLQAAIHVKEGLLNKLDISLENSMTYQIFFNMYDSLVGLSGTVKDIEQELNLLFEKEIILIPENIKSQREDFSDVMFKTKNESYEYVMKTIKNNYNKNPILIVCQSDNEANKLYNYLLNNYVNLTLFNNSVKYSDEDKIVNEVGMPGNITVSTQLMGRGTDIILKSNDKSKGLIVLCIEHFLSKRIDLQVRGRAGRQGETGYTQFINTLEDEIFKILSNTEKSKLCSIYKSKLPFETKGKKYTKYIGKAQERFEYVGLNRRIANYTYDYIIETNKPKFKYDILKYIEEHCGDDKDKQTLCNEALRFNWFLYKKYMLHIKYNIITAYNSYSAMQKYIEFHKISVSQLNEILDKATHMIDRIYKET